MTWQRRKEEGKEGGQAQKGEEGPRQEIQKKVRRREEAAKKGKEAGCEKEGREDQKKSPAMAAPARPSEAPT